MLISCVKVGSNRYIALIPVSVVEWITGPGLVNADVFIYDSADNILGQGKTNEDGFAFVLIEWEGDESLNSAKIKVSKVNYAPSEIKGINITGNTGVAAENQIVTVAANKAAIDPTWTAVPDIEVIFTLADGVTPLDLANTGDVLFQAHVSSTKYWDVMYASVGYVPWAGASDDTAINPNLLNAVFDLSFAGMSGIVPVHIVVYDHNRSRLDLVYLANVTNTSAPVTLTASPTDLMAFVLTTDARVEFYVDPRGEQRLFDENGKLSESLNLKIESESSLRGAPAGCNLIVEILCNPPATGDTPIGFNFYRSDTSATTGFRKIGFSIFPYMIDDGYGLKVGQSSWYKARAVYGDGSESTDSNVLKVVPLDTFQVELITPSDGSENVSQVPVFSWKPVKQGITETAQVGMGVTPEASIMYDYSPWIYDCNHNDQQHIVPIVQTVYGFRSYGPKIITVPFLAANYYDEITSATYPVTWLQIPEGGSAIPYPYGGLEAYKSYEWGMDYAAALYISPMDTYGGLYFALSVSVDLGYGMDYFFNEAEYYNGFTTGNDLGVFGSQERDE